MKRFLTLLFILLLTLSLGMNALADVIYEPEDSFFKKHRDECYYENRVYIASGEAGYAAIMKDPKSNKKVEELPNGTEAYVSYVWDKEGGWALLDRRGWISLTELTVKYDSVSFEAEYGKEFLHPEDPEFLDLTGCEGFGLWEYPGDKAPYARLSWTGEDAWFTAPPDDLFFNTIYEGPDGLRWGYVHYYYGRRDFWVCLSDPDLGRIPDAGPANAENPGPGQEQPTEAPADLPSPTAAPSAAPETSAPTEAPLTPPDQRESASPWAPAALAVGAMALAGGLLAVFRRKK